MLGSPAFSDSLGNCTFIASRKAKAHSSLGGPSQSLFGPSQSLFEVARIAFDFRKQLAYLNRGAAQRLSKTACLIRRAIGGDRPGRVYRMHASQSRQCDQKFKSFDAGNFGRINAHK